MGLISSFADEVSRFMELDGRYAALKFLGFLAIFWLPASYFTKSARREMKRRRDAKQFH
jgi:hypothetical protein